MTMLYGIVVDGCDNIADTLNCGVTSYGGAVLSTTVPAIFTGNSFYCTADPITINIADQAGKTLYGGFWFYKTNSGTGQLVSIDGQCEVRVNASNLLEIRRGNSVILATGATTIAINTWYQVRFSCFVDNTTGSFSVYLDGNSSPEVSTSGVDTQAISTNTVGSVIYMQSGNTYLYQPVLFNDQGSKNNGAVPWTFMHEIIYPTADGATTWTPSAGGNAYSLIDDVQGSEDDSTTYVYATTATKNVVGTGNPTGDVGGVAAVVINSRMSRVSTGTVGVKVGTKVSSTENQTSTKYLPAGYVSNIDVFEYKTGTTAFTAADLDDLELTAEFI